MDYRFKDIREQMELKQHQVAKQINLSRGAYANIEAEAANIKLKTLLLYCNKYNFTLDYISRLDKRNRFENINGIETIDKHILSARLTILETENHMKSVDVARLLGICKSTYSEYKNPNCPNMIQTLMLKKLASEYGYSMDWLIGRSERKYIFTRVDFF